MLAGWWWESSRRSWPDQGSCGWFLSEAVGILKWCGGSCHDSNRLFFIPRSDSWGYEVIHAERCHKDWDKKKSFILHGKRESTWTDGFTVEFFNHAWHIVKSDCVAAIASFFRSSKLLTEVNSTLITLVPKIPNPSTVADFRPISCCNVVYKCITEVVANRLQACLNFLVNSNQTAFIKGRNIS